jgi:methionine biosynthesis protein MetW
MRLDHSLISEWITAKSRVLDLGCGDGTLLAALRDRKQTDGLGIEIDHQGFQGCIERGINVVEQDLNEGLKNFADQSFDMVIMAQALQTLRYPDQAIDEMLRVGRECIVTFPNFGNWHSRLYLSLFGRMPVSKFLPYTWYDTPNIHFCTVADFDALCASKKIRVLRREFISGGMLDKLLAPLWPNLFAISAVYHIAR